MGYWEEANWIRTGIYNDEFYKRATRETGCRAYYPEGVNENDATRGKGCWRLATIRENWAINSAEAWCIEEHDTNGRKAYVSYGSGNLIDDYKENKKYRYNCTLDVRPPELSDFIVSSSTDAVPDFNVVTYIISLPVFQFPRLNPTRPLFFVASSYSIVICS